MTIIKKVFLFVILVFLIYQYGLPVFWDGCRLMTSEHFGASGIYAFVTENRLAEDIIIEAYNINDLPFREGSRREQLLRAQYKQLTKIGVKIPAGESKTITLPSMVDFNMGILVVVARTELKDRGWYKANQRLGIFILYPEDTVLKHRPERIPIHLVVDSENTSEERNGAYYTGNNIQHIRLRRVLQEQFKEDVKPTEMQGNSGISGSS